MQVLDEQEEDIEKSRMIPTLCRDRAGNGGPDEKGKRERKREGKGEREGDCEGARAGTSGGDWERESAIVGDR